MIIQKTQLRKFDVLFRFSVISFLLIAGILLTFYKPGELALTSCAFKSVTGHSCPTCGLTRSLHSLLTFNLVDSLFFHPMGVVLFTGAVFILVKFGYELYNGKIIEINRNYFSIKIVFFSIFVFWFLFWITRIITE